LRSVNHRGLYKIERLEADAVSTSASGERKLWPMLLAANGPSDESRLSTWTRDDFESFVEASHVRWVGADEKISLAGKAFISHDAWKILMLVALLCLLAEMVFVVITRGLGLQPVAQS